MKGKCHICGAETRLSVKITVFKRSWRKKITSKCPNCGTSTLTLYGARYPGDGPKAAAGPAKS